MFVILIILLMVFSRPTFYWLKESFKPVIYALIIAYMLDSAVLFFMKRLKIRRCQGILLAFIILAALIGFSIYKLVPQIVENINNIVYLIEGNVDIVHIVTDIKSKIDNHYVQIAADYILQASQSVRNMINSALIAISGTLVRFVANIGSGTVAIITSFIISIYMMIEKEDLLARGKRCIFAFFDEQSAKQTIHVFSQANKIFKSFLNGKLLDSLIVGIICSIVFFIFRVPYAILMGTVIGVFNIVPYFGPIIGSVPVVMVSFFVNPPKALTALLIIIVIQQLDANFLDPRIVGGNVGESPFWIITSVTVGGNLFGATGMILGVPVMVLIKTLIEESVNMRLIEKGIEDMEKDKIKVNTKKLKNKNNKNNKNLLP